MHGRRCPFCLSDSSRRFGTRIDIWAKCRNCHSVFRDITPARFQQIHDEAFQDSEYIETVTALIGDDSLSARWKSLALAGRSVLEIGPGTGHLLAAAQRAGWSVEAVESSKVNREYIRDTWGIGSVYAAMDQIPDDRVYDAIVAINVVEHIYDIAGFLHVIRKALAPGGTFFLSTPNGLSLEASALRAWWPMCKVHDHVSFPSPAGLGMAARSSGLRVERVWSSEFPFELPISLLIAIRDRARARRGAGAPGEGQTQVPGVSARTETVNLAAKAALTRFYSVAKPFDPVYRVLGAIGRGGSLKARLTR